MITYGSDTCFLNANYLFCRGLAPRLMGELLIILLANSATFVINTMIFVDMDVKQYCAPLTNVSIQTEYFIFCH